MSVDGIPPIEQRELGMRRLRDLTVGTAVAATLGVGVFSVIAATTNPGRSDVPTGNTPATTAVSSSEKDDSGGDATEEHHHHGLSPSSSGTLNSGSGLPVAVTGGSR